MYGICDKTLAIALTTFWGVWLPTQPVSPTTTNYDILFHPTAVLESLWSRSEAPASVELRMPDTLVHMQFTRERSGETTDLCVPEMLLEHLYGAGQVSGLEKNPAP